MEELTLEEVVAGCGISRSGIADILLALCRESPVVDTLSTPFMAVRKKLKLVALLPETTSLLDEFENVRGL